MKQYKLQELVGTTKKLPRSEGLFYETLISFRKLPECAQLFLPLKLQNHLKSRQKQSSSRASGSDTSRRSDRDLKKQCSEEEEEVQSYLEWKHFISGIKLSSLKNFRRLRKSIIYILPIGPFPENMLVSLVSPQLSFIQSLLNFGEAFFPGISFKLLPQIDYKEITCKTRIHEKSGQLQLLLPDVMQYLSKVMPKNSIGIIGLSWIDFFPGYEWNHILGEGSVQSGCAAISFGHYAMFSNQESQSNISSQGRAESVLSGYNASENSEIQKQPTSSTTKKHAYLSKSFKANRFPISVMTKSRERATSCMDISLERRTSTSISDELMNSPLTNSYRSLKALGSLPSIENSWTRIFAGSSERPPSSSSSLSSAVDDASYDIIKREEADSLFTNHGTEEDVIKLAVAVGCTFHMSCQTMWRLFKCLSHEVCHIFGLSHCNFYECAMNSSRLINEVDEQPLFLCPICMRKLQKFLKFKLLERYRKIREVLQSMNPCCVEKMTVNREGYDVDTEMNLNRNRVNYGIPQWEDARCTHDDVASRHICIEVTREKNQDFDIINVEYTESGENEMGYQEHECHFAQALDKLDDILAFLKRH